MHHTEQSGNVFRVIIGIGCENYTKTDTMCGKMQSFVVLQYVVHTNTTNTTGLQKLECML